MIDKAFIEESGSGRLEPEMKDVYEELRLRNIPVELFTEKRVRRRQLPLVKNALVVGYVDTVLTTLKLLGIEPPPTDDYPSILQPFFHRRIWESTVASLTSWVYEGNQPIFAKPKGRKKRFTGHVFARPDDLRHIEDASTTTPVFGAEVVEWLSEYRIFVNQANIVGIKHYEGDPAIKIDESIASEAVTILENSGTAPVAYAIDFGVISNGKTALVEWNDGFSLGSYGLDKAIYTDLLIARWCQLTNWVS